MGLGQDASSSLSTPPFDRAGADAVISARPFCRRARPPQYQGQRVAPSRRLQKERLVFAEADAMKTGGGSTEEMATHGRVQVLHQKHYKIGW